MIKFRNISAQKTQMGKNNRERENNPAPHNYNWQLSMVGKTFLHHRANGL